MANITERNGKLCFDFRYQGLRCREQTLLPNTPANVKKLERVMQQIEAEITLGLLDYAKYFPKSTVVHKLKRLKHQDLITQGLKVESPSFEEFANVWFEQFLPSWRKSTAEGYRSYLDRQLIPYFRDMSVSDISKSDIMQFRAEASKLRDGTIMPKTVNKFIKLLKMMLTEAADRYHFTPMHLNIKSLREEKVNIEPFSLEDVNLVINNVRADWRAYLVVRFFTGMRTGEVDGLKWENVDFQRREILIRETYSKGRFEYTKNDGSQREIDMSQLVFDTLMNHLGTGKRSGLVFSTRDGNPINNPNFLTRVWKPLLAVLGLTYRRPYQTRHTAATLWLGAGENPAWIAKQMGHVNTDMLFKVYSRYVPNLTRQDGSAMERLMASSITFNGSNSPSKITVGIHDDDNSGAALSEVSFWDQLLESHSNGSASRQGGAQ